MKKGFTIVELLAVITIISVLLLLIIPAVNKTIRDTEDKGYNIQIKTIEDAAINFTLGYIDVLSSSSDFDSFVIDLKLLKDLAFIDFEFKNPKTNNYFSDDSLITLTLNKGVYKAEVLAYDSDTISDDVKYENHIILLKDNSTVSNSNVMVLNINGGLFLGDYTVNITTSSTIVSGYATNIYTVTVGSNSYSIKKLD